MCVCVASGTFRSSFSHINECVCVLRRMRERALVWCVCENLLIQWCEAAGLWLSVQQHTQKTKSHTVYMLLWALGWNDSKWRNNGRYSRFELYPLAAPTGDILGTKCNMCKRTMLFHCPSVWKLVFSSYFYDCGYSSVWLKTCHCGLCADRFTCVFGDMRVSKFGWAVDNRVELRTQGLSDCFWTSSLFILACRMAGRQNNVNRTFRGWTCQNTWLWR